MFTIDNDKLDEVTRIINHEAQPSATESKVAAFVLADWPEGDEHQQWLNVASPKEIADWVIAGGWS